VAHIRYAIPDFDVPSRASMRATLDAIYDAIRAGETLYLHCWGGVGRTGTVVGCLLREQGFDATAAREVIDRKWQAMEKRARHPNSPETGEQVAFIDQWAGD
jgi:protein-tyrosine phosphatase